MLGALKGHLAPAIISSEDNDSQQSLKIIDERTGREYRVPIKHNTIEAKKLAEIKTLEGLPLRCYDPGLMHTCIGSSKICFIDGDKGILRYRGYAIEDLAESSSYEEVFFLLFFGELPTNKQLQEFKYNLFSLSSIPVQIQDLIRTFDRSARPVTIFLSAMAAMSACSLHACSPNACSPNNNNNNYLSSFSFFNDIPTQNKHLLTAVAAGFTIAANIVRHLEGLNFVEPKEGLGLVENFLYMVDKQHHDPVVVRALELLFILHAEHEANSSTAAVLHAASTHADLYSSLAAGIAALSGNRHGSANEATILMLKKIKTPKNVRQFLERVKRREERLMGFGHRVYKSYDPRAFIIRQIALIVFNAKKQTNTLSAIALDLEKAALSDIYFTSRRLYPNIDFYSGVVYDQLGFSEGLFPLLFAVSRLGGWIAHIKELYNLFIYNTEETKMQRPQQIYKGAGERKKDKNIHDRQQLISSAELEILKTRADRRRQNPRNPKP